MNSMMGWGSRVRGLFADSKGPWGSGGSAGDGGGDPPAGGGEGGGPWGEPPRRARRAGLGASNVSALDELVRRSRARFGGGGGLPGRPNRSLILWAMLGFVLIWLVFTSTHSISPGERGVVTQFGRYSR